LYFHVALCVCFCRKFASTGQQIAAYATLKPSAALQLEFLVLKDEERIKKIKRKGLFGSLFGAAEDLKEGVKKLCRMLSYPARSLVNCLLPGRQSQQELAELEAEAALNIVDEDDDEEESDDEEGGGEEEKQEDGGGHGGGQFVITDGNDAVTDFDNADFDSNSVEVGAPQS
jgi:hypothetical protein